MYTPEVNRLSVIGICRRQRRLSEKWRRMVTSSTSPVFLLSSAPDCVSPMEGYQTAGNPNLSEPVRNDGGVQVTGEKEKAQSNNFLEDFEDRSMRNQTNVSPIAGYQTAGNPTLSKPVRNDGGVQVTGEKEKSRSNNFLEDFEDRGNNGRKESDRFNVNGNKLGGGKDALEKQPGCS